MDTHTVPILRKTFNIVNAKTYNPPTLDNIPEEFLFCLFIGFIDGDGNIRKQTDRQDSKIMIKCHKSWEDVLALFNKNVKETKDGYVYITFTKTSDVRGFKQRALDLSLPILERKWDVIDLNYRSKYEIASEWHGQALKLFNKGYRVCQIAKEMSKNYSTVFMFLKKGGYFD